MEKYEELEMEVIEFEGEDIITDSNTNTEWTGGNQQTNP